MDLYNELKQEVRRKAPYLYERWKAGGFLVDADIMSMYPHLGRVVDELVGPEDDETENDEFDPEDDLTTDE